MIVLATLTVMTKITEYIDARCPQCEKRLFSVPTLALEVRAVTAGSGRGSVVSCPRCRTLCEVTPVL